MDIILHSKNPTVEVSLKLVVDGDKLLIIDTDQDLLVGSLNVGAAYGDEKKVYGYFLTLVPGDMVFCADKNIIEVSHKN